MISQLGSGDDDNNSDFLINTYFFTAAWTSGSLRKNVKKCCDKNDHQNIYFHYAWNTLNATAFGGIFWTILYFRREYFVKLPRNMRL